MKVVVYDANGGGNAAMRVVHVRAFGHADVAVLDGGPAEGGCRPKVMKIDDIRANLEAPQGVMVNARSTERYAGTAPEPRPSAKTGHVPLPRHPGVGEGAVGRRLGAPSAASPCPTSAAIADVLTALLKAGDHVLCWCRIRSTGLDPHLLHRTRWWRPVLQSISSSRLRGENIELLFKPNTTVVFCETPGSLTFEVQDIPGIGTVAHTKGAIVIANCTWASPIFYRPFEKGINVSVPAATKYIVGHSDAMFGTICTSEELFPIIKSNVVKYAPIRSVRRKPTSACAPSCSG